ncbi:MAG: 2-amino-4-hydroxy-6-hydroxymethyldihydropteridine diphosphokinase [Planctomycetota bacterium]|jgi:2-amino-4-hydroxy-6-hydroxymethyldihydropteridine diphosphokinase
MTGPTAGRTAYLGLGSNLGGRLAAMRAAVSALDGHPRIRVDLPHGVGSLYESPAVVPRWAQDEQPPYLNSAVRVETTLLPAELMRAALDIEASLGRVRRRRWEPRIIDIDLLLYDKLVLNDKDVTLPHPRMHERRFVLEPLAEVAGDLLHPTLHTTIAVLARELAGGGQGGVLTSLADPQWVKGPAGPDSRVPTRR